MLGRMWRIQTLGTYRKLFRYLPKLPGDIVTNDAQIRHFMMNSFPTCWQQSCMKGNKKTTNRHRGYREYEDRTNNWGGRDKEIIITITMKATTSKKAVVVENKVEVEAEEKGRNSGRAYQGKHYNPNYNRDSNYNNNNNQKTETLMLNRDNRTIIKILISNNCLLLLLRNSNNATAASVLIWGGEGGRERILHGYWNVALEYIHLLYSYHLRCHSLLTTVLFFELGFY